MQSFKNYITNLNYYENIEKLSIYVHDKIKDVSMIVPILPKNVDYTETTDTTTIDTVTINKIKLKFNIIKNISNNSKNKTHSHALWYYNAIIKDDIDDKIGYYIDYHKDYNILLKLINDDINKTAIAAEKTKLNDLKDFLIKLNSEFSDKDLQKKIIHNVEHIYFGYNILFKYHFIDFMVLCIIFILSISLLSLKSVIDLYKSGLIILTLMFLLVCIVIFFESYN